jgi:Spaetzle
MKALLAEFRGKMLETDEQDDEYRENGRLKRREDMVPTNGMCPSIIRYARPQKARSATGEWKYIVNTGQHTQTLRLEKCR